MEVLHPLRDAADAEMEDVIAMLGGIAEEFWNDRANWSRESLDAVYEGRAGPGMLLPDADVFPGVFLKLNERGGSMTMGRL